MKHGQSQALRSFFRSTRPYLLLALFTAFALRLSHVTAFSFWTDEGLTPLRAGYDVLEILSNRITIQQGVTTDTHPPLFYLIIHMSRHLLGETDFAFRYPSVLAGVLLPPLLYQFGRRLQGRALGATAVLLTTINPLHVWYANEARMYTLFTLLAAAAALTLWQAVQTEAQRNVSSALAPQRPSAKLTRSLLLYILLSGLALYTHYTAVFLIAAQAPFLIWILWRQEQKQLIVGTAVIGLLAALPLIPYTVPRLFRGVEANFYSVSPLIMLQDVIRFFNLGVTVDFHQLPIQLLNAAAFLLLLLGLYAAQTWPRRLFLLVYLLAVVFGLMLGSLLFKPMYQGARHVMVGSPAFLLLVSWGVVHLWQRAGYHYSVISKQYSVYSKQYSVTGSRLPIIDYRLLVTGFAALAATAVLIAGPLHSLHNFYTNNRYAKDDFRQAIHFIERRAGDNDVIVYNNAILLPLHDHYRRRADVAVTASPIYPTHAAETAAAQLEQLAAVYARIWFITDPPADGRDANELVRAWLDDHLALVDETPFPARTTLLAVRVYDTRPRALRELPPQSQPLSVAWRGWPQLAAVQIDGAQPTELPALWLSLFWQRDSAPPPTAVLQFQLIGPDDRPWATITTPLISEDVMLTWQGDGLLRLSYNLPLPAGVPPGSYAIRLAPLPTTGSAAGDADRLTTISYAGGAGWTAVSPQPYTTRSSIIFANGLTLQGLFIPDRVVRPGHTLPLSLYWQAGPNSGDLSRVYYQVEVRDENGELLRMQQDPPGPRWLEQWPPDTLIRGDTGLYFPPDTEPGRYLFSWQLFDSDVLIEARPSWWPWWRTAVPLGDVQVVPWPLLIDLPTDATVVQAQFGEEIELYGYKLSQSEAALDLTLTWRAQAAPAENYLVFVHLVNADNEIVSQRDVIPVEGVRPTGGWRAGEVLADPHTLTLPPDLPPGNYALRVGLFRPDTFIRPPVTIDGAPQPDNQVQLTTVTLP